MIAFLKRRWLLLSALCALVLVGAAVAIWLFGRNPVEPNPVSKAEPKPEQRPSKKPLLTKHAITATLKKLAIYVARTDPNTASEVKHLAGKNDAELLAFITSRSKDLIEGGKPGWETSCYYVAEELRDVGKYGEAVELLRYAIYVGEKRTSDRLAIFDSSLGSVLKSQGNYEEAEVALRRAVTRYPNSEEEADWRDRQALWLVDFLIERGKRAEAISVLEDIVTRAEGQSRETTSDYPKRAKNLLKKLKSDTPR